MKLQRGIMPLAIALLASTAALTGVAGAQPSQRVAAQSVRADSAIETLRAKAERRGEVRVIVRLDVPFELEHRLETRDQVLRQRQAIARAADALVNRIAVLDAEGVKRFQFVPLLAMNVSADELDALLEDPGVLKVSEDSVNKPTLADSVPLIGADVAQARSSTGAGQTVAVLDTGFDIDHPDFGGRIVEQACYSTNGSESDSLCPTDANSQTGSNAAVNCSLAIDGCDHGTHVASIAAGVDGVAPEADIIGVQVFTSFTDTEVCDDDPTPCLRSYTSDEILGLERVYALRGSYNIASANMSLGGGMYTSSCDSEDIKTIIDQLKGAGIATVIASGNDGYGDAVAFPACVSTAVTVGNTTKADAVRMSSNSDAQVDVLAPGTSIFAAVPNDGHATMTGTSMAAPHVAGAFALMFENDAAATVDEVLSYLKSTGVSVTDTKNNLTKPRIQVDEAIIAMRQDQSGTPVVTEPATRCVALSGTIEQTDRGEVYNTSSSVNAKVLCPMVRFGSKPYFAGDVFVVDQNPSASVTCTPYANNVGGLNAGAGMSSAGSSSSYQILTMEGPWYPYWFTSRYMVCTIPPTYNGIASKVLLYRGETF